MTRFNPLMILKLVLIGLSSLLYLISLVSDIYFQITPNTYIRGFECLLLGWLSFFYNWSLLLPWASNLIYLACIPMSFFRTSSFIAIPICFVAILMTLPAFFVSSIMYNEAGMITAISKQIGIFLWLGSYIILFCGLFIPVRWKVYSKHIGAEQPDISNIP